MADRDVEYLLIGGGLAAANCARWLRKSGADGSILLVGRELDLPYDRPPLSKGYLRGAEPREGAQLHDAAWYEAQEIEALTRTSVMKLDPAARTVKLSTKQEVGFGQALVATGANVRRLNVSGAELEGIHYLRTFANSDAIREDAAGKRVVLIGGSYIASEVAASLTELGSTCTMVMLEPVALSRSFGAETARFFHDLLVDHGIEIYGEEELDRFEGADGRVTKVVCKSGRELEADAVVLGAGVAPDVMLARSAGLEIGETGGVRVDAHLQTATPGVFAAGDVAEYESVVHGGRRIRVEHWDVAFTQGKTVAMNMLGKVTPHDVVPYFFSDLSDWAAIEYVGPAFDWVREIIRGSP
ncbi:MAG: NAD(P)/FAD-dependent oxidoreductase, partial [Solirubrobacteraceae bacterium]